MIAKNWIEAHEDQLNAANPDWEIAFLESSLSDETLKRTYGIESILDPYLKDWELIFNMLVLVGAIKMSDRLMWELMGLG